MDGKQLRDLALMLTGSQSPENLTSRVLLAKVPMDHLQVVATLEVAAQLADLNKTLEGVTGPKFSGDPRGYVLTKEVGS